MKAKLFILGVLVTILSSCTYKVCPTYAKKEVKEVNQSPQRL